MTGPRVLLVDDDRALREAVTTVLGEEGYEIDAVGEPLLALRSALDDPPAAILLDVNMPGLDGWEMCEILRRQPQTRAVPVLFLTGRAEVRDRITALQVGGSDFLTKPFTPDQLRARVRALVAPAPEMADGRR